MKRTRYTFNEMMMMIYVLY